MPNPIATITWEEDGASVHMDDLDDLTNDILFQGLAGMLHAVIDYTQHTNEDVDRARAYLFTQFTAQIEDEQ